MNILATFDGSASSEIILPQIEWMSQLPGARFTLLSIVHRPHAVAGQRRASNHIAAGQGGGSLAVASADTAAAEDRDAVERTLTERRDYLQAIVLRMPPGPEYLVEVMVADGVTAAIIRYAMEHRPDVIVMGTHGETGMVHRVFGDTAEALVRSGVAPVLLVHSGSAHRA